jgi:hypothetical protein
MRLSVCLWFNVKEFMNSMFVSLINKAQVYNSVYYDNNNHDSEGYIHI